MERKMRTFEAELANPKTVIIDEYQTFIVVGTTTFGINSGT